MIPITWPREQLHRNNINRNDINRNNINRNDLNRNNINRNEINRNEALKNRTEKPSWTDASRGRQTQNTPARRDSNSSVFGGGNRAQVQQDRDRGRSSINRMNTDRPRLGAGGAGQQHSTGSGGGVRKLGGGGGLRKRG